MITELYTFTPGSYVVADEWNANFKTLYQANVEHSTAITDAYNDIAFPNSDLTAVFNAVTKQPNSFFLTGNSVTIVAECEYYKKLNNGEDLIINIPDNFNSESRIAINFEDNRTLLPFVISYSGNYYISYGQDKVFPAGNYFILIYETNGVAQVKLIWTGV